MEIIEINSSNFEAEVEKSDKTVFVDFFANWCMPCKILSQTIDEVAKKRNDVKFCKIDVDKETELAIKFNVSSIPTVVVFKNGKAVGVSVGVISESAINELIDR